jgi:UDP-N-acetylglucosamine:LPS N-acetylglucosamine transferase
MKIAIVSSRGGHLTETLQLLEGLRGHEYFFVTSHSPRDRELEKIAPVRFCRTIDARPVPFLFVFFWAISVLLREKPDVILSLGAEVALPFFFWGRLLGMKTIYIESWCRVKDLSLTGRLVYRWVDEFWVQWPQLQRLYSAKAKYKGSIV